MKQLLRTAAVVAGACGLALVAAGPPAAQALQQHSASGVTSATTGPGGKGTDGSGGKGTDGSGGKGVDGGGGFRTGPANNSFNFFNVNAVKNGVNLFQSNNNANGRLIFSR
ncbi:hypothetical protein NGB36_03710 [Streptomyces sp. RB6PN25]|uniref:Uncharacterized protein n=1 Tax=Streptomyces humicola TaxID=2953240 RepID=A0ABT1PPW8_9ACTN|nr:hypothetical protein [Streptomyces humicola]MCQ4079722.1 hypothetical protein [Streptomyces humicola]